MNSNYLINTGYIFQDLWNHFKKYNRGFLLSIVKPAYESLLFSKKIYTIHYDGKNGGYLDDYALNRHPIALKFAKDIDQFPFPDYFLRPQEGTIHLAIIYYDTPLEIRKEDYDYDLFFALKLSLTDIMDADKFLKYHLADTFENDISLFKNFLETICNKYNEFLQEKYLPLIQRFLIQQSINLEPVKENNKEFTTARQVLAINYLLEELNIDRSNTTLTEIARFIQFLTGKETGVAKINDTTIYKKVKQPFSKTDKAAEKDLQYIRTYFENLGLQSIVKKLNKEIGSKE
ncbi:MAG: hypothetical protein ABIN01_11960 [Ferruginibacter sp.]